MWPGTCEAPPRPAPSCTAPNLVRNRACVRSTGLPITPRVFTTAPSTKRPSWSCRFVKHPARSASASIDLDHEANWHDFDFSPAVYETRPNTTRTVRGGDLKQRRGFCGVWGLSCGQGSHPWWHCGAPPHHAHTRARTHTLHTHAASGRGSHSSVITCPPYTHHTKSEAHFRTRTQVCASVTQTHTTPHCPSASSSERAS